MFAAPCWRYLKYPANYPQGSKNTTKGLQGPSPHLNGETLTGGVGGCFTMSSECSRVCECVCNEHAVVFGTKTA